MRAEGKHQKERIHRKHIDSLTVLPVLFFAIEHSFAFLNRVQRPGPIWWVGAVLDPPYTTAMDSLQMKTENPYEAPQTELAKTKDAPRPPMHKVAKALVAISITFSIISLVCGLIAWAFIIARWLS